MSISITPTSIALASIDRTLRTASNQFDASCSQSSVDTRFVRSLFVARSGNESGQLDQQVCRLLLEGILAESAHLSTCFAHSVPSSSVTSTGCTPSASTPTSSTQTRSSFSTVTPQLPSPSATSPAASSTSSVAATSPISSGRNNNNRLKLKGSFCSCVLKQLIVNCVSDPSRASIRRFYSFVDTLEERVCELRVGQHGNFLDGLLCKELSLPLVPQCLVELVLLTSCVVPHVIKALSQHLKTLFESLLEATNKSDNNSIFDCSISAEFVHQLFTALTSSQIVDLLPGDRQTTAHFLRFLEKGFVSRGPPFPCTLAPAHILIRVAFESRSSGVPLSSSEHLSPADFVDLEDKDLEPVMEGLANQNPNLLAQQIQELGAIFTSNVAACKQHLTALNAGDAHSLNSVSLSRVIVMMINTCTPSTGMQHVQQAAANWDHRTGSAPVLGTSSSTDSGTGTTSVLSENSSSVPSGAPVNWNAKVFATAVNEISSNLNWSEVVMHLDQPNFFIRNKTQLQFLTTLLLEGLGSSPFPIALLYREWNFHKIGQFSWIEQILQNPDVFCFTDYPHRAVNLSALKVQPEDANRDLTNWRSLDLIDILLRLSDVRKLLNNVMNVLHKPISTCADVLLLGLLQIPAPVNGMRSHLFQVLVPMLIGSHPNAIAVLNVAWNSDELNKPPFQIRNVILSALCNYYMKNPDDQSKLTRILEVAHELKPNGLAELFNLPQFPFTIDLACLASRRDFLKLDKWIEDKLNEHGETFATHLISYIRRRLPLGVVTASQGGGLPQETLQTLLTCLSKPATVSSVTMSELQQLFHQMRHLQIKNGDARTVGVNMSSRTQVGLPQTSGGSVFGGAQSVQQQSGGTFSNFPFSGSGIGASSRDQVLAAAAQQLQNRQQQQQTGGLPASMQMFGGIGGGTPMGTAPNSAAAAFAQQTDLLKTWSAAGSGLQPSFGGGNALSMSPSGQMMRTGFLGANGSTTATRSPGTMGTSGWSMPTGIPGTGGLRSTPGPTTPSSSIDFRAQLPPGAPGSAAGMLGGTGAFSAAGGTVQPQPSAAAGRITASMADDLTAIQFNEEIQNEANMYFQQIYSQHSQMSVNEFVARLKAFKNSPNQKDRDVLACVVKNLFEEYRFFHEYPERELRTTAEVYGGIIREGIISNLQFATAVRKVIESLQAEPGSMLWTFGIVSLNACRSRLCTYPKVCVMIANQESFHRFPPALKEYVTAGVQGQLPQGHGRETPNWQQQPQRTNSNASESARAIPSRTGTSVLSVTSVDTLVNATEREGSQIKQPPDSTIEKVSFLFNNLSQSNLPKKTEEMRAMMNEMGEDFVRWLAQYMVMKRVSIEQNFQPLYNNFLMSVGDRQLENFVKQETFRNIKILLRSDKRQAASNFGDRQLLKNLGLWLGAITIARDRPIVTSVRSVVFLGNHRKRLRFCSLWGAEFFDIK
uniref:CCR4-NOT transcription complex subunit 1 n=1 Tax=Parascaris univalens TaxID=6257 RepID=A0A915B8H0_PARUN